MVENCKESFLKCMTITICSVNTSICTHRKNKKVTYVSIAYLILSYLIINTIIWISIIQFWLCVMNIYIISLCHDHVPCEAYF